MPTEKRLRQRENTRARQQAIAAAEKQSKRRRRIIVVSLAVLAIGGAVFYATQGGDEETPVAAGATTSTSVAPRKGNPDKCPPKAGATKQFRTFEKAPTMCIDPAKKYTAEIKTDAGTITVELNAEAAPKTVNNFVFLARNRYYDGVIFHRVISDFMDQTGDPTGTGRGGQTEERAAAGLPPPFPGYQFEDEIPEGYVYAEDEVAMANSGPNTNGSQFFLVASEKGAETLLTAVGGVPKYTPFGKVTKGLSVVKKINRDGSGGGSPNVEHRMISVRITEE